LTVVIGYDPVAAEVFVEDAGGGLVIATPAERVFVKHYRGEGILYIGLNGRFTTLAFLDNNDRYRSLSFSHAGGGDWRVQVGDVIAQASFGASAWSWASAWRSFGRWLSGKAR
jgi:hypothetical protein